MSFGRLKPRAISQSQLQSQRYIKSIRSLGDVWGSFAEQSLSESSRNSALVETKFDLVSRLANALEEQRQLKPTIVEMPTHRTPAALQIHQTIHTNRSSSALSYSC
jgi:hypothetical protein